MKIGLLTASLFLLSAIGNAQEKNGDNTKIKFTPPVIVKDKPVAPDPKEKLVFTPPVIVKDKPSKVREPKPKQHAKFKPPVIKKDQ